MWWYRSGSTLGSGNGLLPDGPKPLPDPGNVDLSVSIQFFVLSYLPKTNFTGSAQDMDLLNKFEKYTCKIIPTSPRGQWVDLRLHHSDGFVQNSVFSSAL